MTGFLLTDAERQRFAGWLEWEAEQGFKMVEIMKQNKLPDAFIKKEHNEAMAAKILAKKLRETELFSVSG